MTKYRFLIFLLALSVAPYAQAADTELVVQAGVERFRWREFDEFGTRLLEEKGKRGNIGVTWDNFRRDTSGILYGANGRIYSGTVEYDGQTQSGIPIQTDTDYFGINIEGQGGYRVGRGFAFDLLGAIGLDYWIRSLQDTRTASGIRVIGYDEEYTILYAKFGPGIFHDVGAWRYRLNLGVKYPFYTDEYVDEGSVPNLSPKGRASGFARFQADFGRSRRLNFGFAIYYDSYRFAESERERIFGGLVWQPESHMDVRGVQLRLSVL